MTAKTIAELVALDDQIRVNKDKRDKFYYPGSPHMRSSDPYKGPRKEKLLALDLELQGFLDAYYGDFTDEDFADKATLARLDAMKEYRDQQKIIESAYPNY